MTDGWRRGGIALGAVCAVAFGAVGLGSLGCTKTAPCVGSACASPNPPGSSGGSQDGGPRDPPDAGPDAGPQDAGPGDAGVPDAGRPDAGGPLDGGPAPDGGPVTFGGPGPWPMENVIYGAANGLHGQVVGMSTDETQNLWVATTSALFLLRPGDSTFHEFTSADGLHLEDNPMQYCNDAYNMDASPLYPGWTCKDRKTPTVAGYGTAISTIVGGGPNEVLVGYHGIHDWSSLVDSTKDDPFRHTGMVDRVRLRDDGSIEVMRFDLNATNALIFWHDREIERMVYDHIHHPHVLYVGTEHGVTLLMPDRLRYPNSKTDSAPPEYWHNVNYEFMADHLHAHVCIQEGGCPDNGDESGQVMGDWRGLALDLNGDLWTAGRWTAGEIRWDPDVDPNGTKNVSHWSTRPGSQAFSWSFGDPYKWSNAPLNSCGQPNPPVFPVAKEGDVVSLTAVTVSPDGTVWFASGATYSDDVALGIASFSGNCFHYFSPSQAGLAEQNVKDLVALPDGRLVVAGPTSGLSLWNPATGRHHPMNAGNNYLPDNHVQRLELDTRVDPPALHVATATGAATIRQFPAD